MAEHNAPIQRLRHRAQWRAKGGRGKWGDNPGYPRQGASKELNHKASLLPHAPWISFFETCYFVNSSLHILFKWK